MSPEFIFKLVACATPSTGVIRVGVLFITNVLPVPVCELMDVVDPVDVIGPVKLPVIADVIRPLESTVTLPSSYEPGVTEVSDNVNRPVETILASPDIVTSEPIPNDDPTTIFPLVNKIPVVSDALEFDVI